MPEHKHVQPLPSATPCRDQSCQTCPTRTRCLPRGLSDSDCALVNQSVVQRHGLLRGEYLYRTNDPVGHRLYAIRSGQFKTYHLSPDGEQRIAGFQFAGDFLGLDAIGLALHRNTTVALSDALLCEFSYPRLVEATLAAPALAARFRELLGRQLAQAQTISLLLANRAEQKISGFLLALPADRRTDERQTTVVNLAMSRADIGAYLGLADTTVSRTLSRFQRLGYLRLRHRQLTILDAVALRAISASAEPAGPGVAPILGAA
ncbi:helix-turn-helix domain-containing protein [Duganella vulcania]|uniref:Helix-turn-helix domain-containing protein n=1 Tax=Duganella vulcania TaxID=2692166 RepID=A0A845GL24_9BURK|nr:helix-turn-helix domain-containing protein [Duganella vulcania]MYM94132.1 helix-turn-helix domain-containing protein [Duganella vulcania]